MNTFWGQGLLDGHAALAWAAVIGIAFGFWLERGGFGSSRKLTGLFYFRDFAVFQVMFTALITALVGLEFLRATDLVDVAAVYRPETFLGAQTVGGLVFGAGFVIGGWCPGTAMVGLASGKGDALAFLAGAGLGSLGFAALFPAIQPLAESGACGIATLPASLGLPEFLVVILVLAMAFGGFIAIAKFGRGREMTVGGGDA